VLHDDVDGPSACRLRLIDLPFSEINSRQIVQAVCNIEMVGAERLFPNRQSTFVKLLGIGVAALLSVEVGQIVQTVGYGRVVGAQCSLADRQSAPVQRLSLGTAVFVRERGC